MSANASKATPKLKVKRRQSGATQRPQVPSERQASLDLDQELDEVEQNVNVQVRPREPSPERGRSKFGMLKEQTSGAIREGFEGIKRPLSSLLKRPGSRSGSKDRSANRSASKERDLENIELPTEDIKPHSAGSKVPRKTGMQHSVTESWAVEENAKPAAPARPGSSMGGRPGSSMGSKRSNQSPSRNVITDTVDGYVPTDGNETTTIEASDFKNDRNSPDIPQLDEMHMGEFGSTVAQAPSVAVNRMQSYKDLDGELAKQAAFQNLDGIDLSLLTKCLCPESEVRDEQVPWTWDYLFTSVCGDLRRDWAEENMIDDEEDQHDGEEKAEN